MPSTRPITRTRTRTRTLTRTRTHTTRAFRGATLIELMVSLALLGGILSVTVGLLVGAIQNGARARARSALTREATHLDALLRQELRMAGLGVPNVTGTHIDSSYGSSPGSEKFDTDVILATSTAVGVIGDFPRPDAQYNTLGTLANSPAGSADAIMWLNENTGTCPPNTSGSCSIADASPFFFNTTGNLCNSSSSTGDRSCPWGMKRANAGDAIQIVNGAGAWTTATIRSPLTMVTNGANGNLFLKMASTWNAAWPNVTSADPPVAVSGEGFVTTIDRVFYQFNSTAGTLERIQCFGDPDPQNIAWPNLVTNTMPALSALALTPPNGGTVNTCIGPETIAKDVSSVSFSYFDRTGNVTTTKNVIARIDWQIKLQRTMNTGRPVTQDIVGSVAVRALAQ